MTNELQLCFLSRVFLALHPTRIFSMALECQNKSCNNIQFKIVPENKPKWIIGHVPPDRPLCGFFNEICKKTETQSKCFILILFIRLYVYLSLSEDAE